ncbi:MAG: acyl-CoA dehydrogenase family protein [Chloroflexi bacterium]|nr:acyl-CoA dehydrogenase family protein [Chloroflexota bacterium]
MDFDLTEEQQMLKQTARQLLEQEIVPLVDEYERERKAVGKDVLKKLVPLGYIGGLIPEADGGFGINYTSYFILIEELGRVWGSLRTMVTTTANVVRSIHMQGTSDQKKRLLHGLMNADTLGFVAITEPDVGSDAGSVKTRAILNGDAYFLTGTKTLITNGSTGDLGIVFTSTDPELGPRGVTAFIAEKGETPYGARDIRKMGMDCSVLSELSFDNSRVPRENLLGERGRGLSIALALLNYGRCGIAFAVIGASEACIEAAVKYARERTQFGQPIGSFQLVQEMIVDMVVKVDAARFLAARAAWLMDKGVRCNREASIAKLYATEAALEVTATAVQVHGGYGYTKEYPVERHYRDIRHLTLAEGTSQIQKLIIGREVLGINALR